MAQYAIDLMKEKEASLIRAVMSIVITFAAILSMYMMNDYFPDLANTWFRIVINLPSLALFAIAIVVLIIPEHVEW